MLAVATTLLQGRTVPVADPSPATSELSDSAGAERRTSKNCSELVILECQSRSTSSF